MPGLRGLIGTELQYLESSWPDLAAGRHPRRSIPGQVFFIDDKLSGIIDFYFACNDALAYDIAVCLNAWCFRAKSRFEPTKGRALLGGYNSVRRLDRAERDAMPILARGAACAFC